MMFGKTGEECKISGEYRCTLHKGNITQVKAGYKFPPCGITNHLALWRLKTADYLKFPSPDIHVEERLGTLKTNIY